MVPSTPPSPDLSDGEKINDNLYILHDGGEEFNMSIIFFHGPCRDEDNPRWVHFKNFYSTKSDRDGESEILWPKVWLAKCFPRARIFATAYDTSFKTTSTTGREDYFLIAENLLYGITDLAQEHKIWSQPVVLVGHSIGGIVIKALLRQAHHLHSVGDQYKIKKFLANVRLIFYFSTPHLGMSLPQDVNREALSKSHFWPWWSSFSAKSGSGSIGPLYDQAKELDPILARQYQKFQDILNAYSHWQQAGVGEGLCTKLTSLGIEAMLVSEASSRSGLSPKYLYMSHDDHFSICRPQSEKSITFLHLVECIKGSMPSSYHSSSLPAGKDTNKHVSSSSDSSIDLGALVKLLADDANPDDQYAAAKDLQARAKVNSKLTRKAIADCPGVVQTLVRLLEGSGRHEDWDADGRLRSSSAWTLSHLATASGSRIVDEPQAVGRLIKLLDVDGPGGGIPDVRKAAVFALNILAWVERCKVLICTIDGVLEKLLRLMKDDPDEGVREKATATIAFSSEKAQYQGRIVRHPGVFEGLVEALRDREGFSPAYSDLQYFAAYALGNLVRVPPYEDRVANTAGALQSLVTLLGANRRGPSWTDDVRVRVAWIFHLMAKKELNLMKIAKCPGALEALVKALEDVAGDPLQLHSSILATVVFLAKNPEIRVMIANVPGSFTNLKNQLLEGKIDASGERKTRLTAACALALLAETNEVKLQIKRMPLVFESINRVLQEGGKIAEYDRFNKLTSMQVLN